LNSTNNERSEPAAGHLVESVRSYGGRIYSKRTVIVAEISTILLIDPIGGSLFLVSIDQNMANFISD
jgi:hypothetical protein